MRHILCAAALLFGTVLTSAAADKWPLHPLSTTQMSEVKQIMANIEQRADHFETEFLKGLRSSTVAIEERQKYRVWVDQLEDQLDNMAEAYKEGNMSEAQEELGQAMEAARNLNQFLLKSKWSPEAESSWRSIRDDLNKLAGFHRAPPTILIIATR